MKLFYDHAFIDVISGKDHRFVKILCVKSRVSGTSIYSARLVTASILHIRVYGVPMMRTVMKFLSDPWSSGGTQELKA